MFPTIPCPTAGRPRSALVLALLAVLVATPGEALAQKKKKKKKVDAIEYFDGDLATAQKEARERNVPVLILCCKEDEEANDRFREQLKDNKNLANATQDVIVIVANDGSHAMTKKKVKGPDGKTVEVEVCESYHTESCDVHKRNWDAIYQTFVAGPKDGLWELPEAIVVLADWSIDSRICHGQPPGDSEMISALQKARVRSGPGISREELVEVRQLATEGRRMNDAKLWAEAWRAWDGVLAIAAAGPFTDEATPAREAAVTGMRGELARAVSMLTPETVKEGYRMLAGMLTDFAGTPLEDEVESAVKRAEANSELRETIIALKKELEAEALLREAEELFQKGDERKARARIKKLLGKKYADTEAARLAREKYE